MKKFPIITLFYLLLLCLFSLSSATASTFHFRASLWYAQHKKVVNIEILSDHVVLSSINLNPKKGITAKTIFYVPKNNPLVQIQVTYGQSFVQKKAKRTPSLYCARNAYDGRIGQSIFIGAPVNFVDGNPPFNFSDHRCFSLYDVKKTAKHP